MASYRPAWWPGTPWPRTGPACTAASRHRADLAGRQVDDERLEVARGLVEPEVQREVGVRAGLGVGGRGGDARRREGLGAAGARRTRAATSVAPRDSRLSTAAMCQIAVRRAPAYAELVRLRGPAVTGGLARSGGVLRNPRYARVRQHAPRRTGRGAGFAAVGGGVAGAAASAGARVSDAVERRTRFGPLAPGAPRRLRRRRRGAPQGGPVARGGPGLRRAARCSATSAPPSTGTSCNTTRRARR